MVVFDIPQGMELSLPMRPYCFVLCGLIVPDVILIHLPQKPQMIDPDRLRRAVRPRRAHPRPPPLDAAAESGVAQRGEERGLRL